MKPGYQKTELGVIPSDWDILPLGSLLSFKNGLNKAKEFFGYGTPIVNYMDVFQSPGLHKKDIQGRVHVDRNELKSYEVRKGDVFFTRTSETVEEIGISSVVLEETPDTVFSGFVLRGRPVDESFDDEYKKYCFSATYFRKQVTSRASYTTRALTNGRSLAASLLVRPPFLEQKRIATVLSDIDALVSSLEQLIAKKRNIQQATMQQLLTGQRRLPRFSGEWNKVAIGDHIDLLTGFPFPSSHYSSSGIRLLRGSNVKRGQTDWGDNLVQYWPSLTSDIAKYELAAGDLVIAMDGSLVGRSFARLDKSDLPAVLLQRVARIRSKTIDIGFLTHQIASDLFVSYCDSVKTVTAIPHISSADIRGFVIPLPPTLEEQTAIATTISDMGTELAALEARRNKARQLKLGMMQELLTGRIRLV